MPDAGRPAADAPLAPGESRRALGLRLAVALATAALAGIVVERALLESVASLVLRGAISAFVAASLIGVALWVLVVVPLSRARQDLHHRYEAALADSLSDTLTGLGNHRAFQEELDRQVEAALRYETPLALVLIDLDEFKTINDRSGHAGGDRALAYFGRLVGGSVRRPDRAFRIGGDEFAVLLPHTDADGARIVARRLLAAALQPLLPAEDQPRSGVSFSAGISAMPYPAGNRSQLYSQADASLYQAKRAGRTEVVVFNPEVEPGGRLGSGAEVSEVIARSQLRPVYQPIMDLASGTPLGVEGLIRPVPPAPFADPAALFGAARASGHLVALDLTCLETIVSGAAAVEPGQFLSVNLSPTTVQAPDFSAAVVLSVLARSGFPPGRLVIELTEREEIDDIARVRDRLEACRRAGIRLAADDVGAGNSGLRLLSELRFDFIKVDLGLVQRSAASEASSAVIESVVSLASRTGALVVGEGIEEPAQLARLTALGVTAGQGYLLGRPAPLRDVAARPSAAAVWATIPARPRADPPATESASPMNSWRQSIGLPAV